MRDLIFTASGKPISDSQIDEVKSLIGAKLPEDYRHFLITTNGGKPHPASFSFDGGGSVVNRLYSIGGGFVDDLAQQFRISRDKYESWILPIGDDVAGSSIALSVSESSLGVVYWRSFESNKCEPLLEVAQTFTEFLNGLTENPYAEPEEDLRILEKAKGTGQ